MGELEMGRCMAGSDTQLWAGSEGRCRMECGSVRDMRATRVCAGDASLYGRRESVTGADLIQVQAA